MPTGGTNDPPAVYGGPGIYNQYDNVVLRFGARIHQAHVLRAAAGGRIRWQIYQNMDDTQNYRTQNYRMPCGEHMPGAVAMHQPLVEF